MQHEAFTNQSALPNDIKENYDLADGSSIFSDITSLETDVSSFTDGLGSHQINKDDLASISPDLGFFSSIASSGETPTLIEQKAASDGHDAPVPMKRHRRINEPKELQPNFDSVKFECCMWVPVEDVARIFASSKDRRIESIARACDCQFLITDTHRLSTTLGVKQLVHIFSNSRADLEKCRNILDEKFPGFYAKASDIIDRLHCSDE
ncbi:unnamed protein product [Mesocestoides corti]|uniref:PINc domain-containing protein n=1 Tax=Mesocestoides corti TaxID=53468 RepID=A0A0R3UB63_MESCO|nr:unnamed protein product [Mesocestoides corti]